MTRPGRPCPTPRCGQLQPCARHPRIPFAKAQRTGLSLYQTARWKRERALYLAVHAWCVDCAASGRGSPATIVDHAIPHRGNEAAFWDQGNWQPLCRSHHQAKTGRETRARVS